MFFHFIGYLKFTFSTGVLLAFGYWLLAIGCWLLAFSYWLLAIGF